MLSGRCSFLFWEKVWEYRDEEKKLLIKCDNGFENQGMLLLSRSTNASMNSLQLCFKVIFQDSCDAKEKSKPVLIAG